MLGGMQPGTSSCGVFVSVWAAACDEGDWDFGDRQVGIFTGLEQNGEVSDGIQGLATHGAKQDPNKF